MPIVAPYPSSIIITVPIEVPMVPLEVKCQIRLFLCRARLPRTSWNGHCVHKSLSFLWLFFGVFSKQGLVLWPCKFCCRCVSWLWQPPLVGTTGVNEVFWQNPFKLASPSSHHRHRTIIAFCQFSEVESFFLLHLNTILKILAMFAMDISIGHWTDRILKPNPDIWPR